MEDLAAYVAEGSRADLRTISRPAHLRHAAAELGNARGAADARASCEHFDVARTAPNSLDAVHLISEAYRLAYADRNLYVGDSDFVSVPVAGMLDPAYLKARAGLIRMDQSLKVAAAGTPAGQRPAAWTTRSRSRPPVTCRSSIATAT